MKSYKFHILSLATLLLLGAATHAEAKIFERKKKKAQTEVKAAPAKQNINGLKPYAQVITPKAKSSFGFLTVHKVDNNYFFEIENHIFNYTAISNLRHRFTKVVFIIKITFLI